MLYSISVLFICLSVVNARALSLSPRWNAKRAICNTVSSFDPSCWDSLGVADYLKKWNASTPICYGQDQANQTGANFNSTAGSDCCNAGEAWSTCFLRLAYKQPGHDCRNINPQDCSWDTLSKLSLGDDAATKFYLLRAIYSE